MGTVSTRRRVSSPQASAEGGGIYESGEEDEGVEEGVLLNPWTY